jgi:peptide/nickel transport system substrate-binding protein
MYGINRANLIQALGGPNVNQPLTHVLPADILGGEEDFDLYPYSVEKAKQGLKDAGYPNGFTAKFLYRPSSEGSRKSFATIQADLGKIGVKVVGVQAPDADFYTKYLQVPDVAKRGVWDISLAGWGADWFGNAALTFFKPLFYGPTSFPPNGSNFGFYNSKKTIDLVDQAVAAATEDEAKALWHQADENVMKDAAFFPITNPKQTLYHAEQVNNAIYIPNYQGYDPTNIWLDPSKNGG